MCGRTHPVCARPLPRAPAPSREGTPRVGREGSVARGSGQGLGAAPGRARPQPPPRRRPRSSRFGETCSGGRARAGLAGQGGSKGICKDSKNRLHHIKIGVGFTPSNDLSGLQNDLQRLRGTNANIGRLIHRYNGIPCVCIRNSGDGQCVISLECGHSLRC